MPDQKVMRCHFNNRHDHAGRHPAVPCLSKEVRTSAGDAGCSAPGYPLPELPEDNRPELLLYAVPHRRHRTDELGEERRNERGEARWTTGTP